MTEQFNLYAFSSQSVTNIWAGVGAELWAVPKGASASTRGKAAKVPVPSFGILYSVADHSLTVPFIILTRPDPERIETDVWHGPWALPFRIKPLGTPRHMLSKSKAKNEMPSFARLATDNFGKIFRVGGANAFNRCDATSADWAVLIDRPAS